MHFNIQEQLNEFINNIQTIQASALMMCAESSHVWKDCEGVMQVALNRSKLFKQPLKDVITAKHQFSLKCPPNTLHNKHYALAIKALIHKKMNVPKWLLNRNIIMFCANYVAYKWCDLYIPVNKILHIYWRRKHDRSSTTTFIPQECLLLSTTTS